MATRSGRRRAAAYGDGLSDYQVNQQNAYASMTPAQRAEYQRKSGLVGLGLAGAALAVGSGGALVATLGAAKAATVAATSASLAFYAGLNAQPVIAPNARPAGTRTPRERGR